MVTLAGVAQGSREAGRAGGKELRRVYVEGVKERDRLPVAVPFGARAPFDCQASRAGVQSSVLPFLDFDHAP